MLNRDKATGRLLKQPAKIGDLIICHSKSGDCGLGFTQHTAYRVVATQHSKEKNRISFKHVYPLFERKDKFGVFIIDDMGDKRYVNIGTDVFGVTWEKLPTDRG